MTHELERREEPARGVHHILLDRLEEASSSVSAQRLSDKSVHDGRKAIKKARATLRLLRDAIPQAVFRRENHALRDIARPLSAVRDAAVLTATLQRLVKLYGPAASAAIPPELRKVLRKEQTQAQARARRSNRGPRAAAASLERARTRFEKLRIAENRWTDIGHALKRIYRDGRRAMHEAARTPSSECLHEWRKQTKHLWHQLQVLQPLWPGTVGELADQAHKLSDYLGDDHDLAVLREKVRELDSVFTRRGGPGPLLALIDRCRGELQAKAFLLGGRIYDERPGVFAARFEQYWERWRREKGTMGAKAVAPS